MSGEQPALVIWVTVIKDEEFCCHARMFSVCVSVCASAPVRPEANCGILIILFIVLTQIARNQQNSHNTEQRERERFGSVILIHSSHMTKTRVRLESHISRLQTRLDKILQLEDIV